MDGKGAIILLSILCIVLLVLYIRERNRQRKLCRRIERIITSYVRKAEDGLNPEQSLSLAISSKDIDRIHRSLDSLREYVAHQIETAKDDREELKTMVTDISHQLKTPVAVMDMSLALLEDESLNEEERREFISRFRAALTELEDLIEVLISISKLESGLISITPSMAAIEGTISSAVSRILSKADDKNIRIEFEADEDAEGLQLRHDKKWTSEAIINILDNAVKYSPAGSQITIRLKRSNFYARIEIEDEGIGVPREETHKIFLRFYRGDHRIIKEQSGSGVGLYLARQIAEKHRGSISVRRGRGRGSHPGSIFVLQLPLE